MSSDIARIEEIFTEALAKDADGERKAFLDDACGQDLELRRRVDGLLVAHDAAGSFLRLPTAPGTTESLPPMETVGESIGPYKLLEQIGEGGFGVVYLAEQRESIRRRVALKILKPGMDTRQIVTRFEAERQALALMDHANIAKVFDAGATATGRPYFVMELVKGISITEYCNQCGLSTEGRLELFIAVCQAVQHAHQKGVIHRDIKPSNVLVAMHEGQPTVKVIDFGVAKAINQRLTEDSLHTGFAQMIGTPLYMSPEQAEMSPLEIDTRGDVYSLGVLLYELLTGTTPFTRERFQKASFDEVRRIIREEEPPTPSSRLSTLDAASASGIAKQRRTEPRRLIRSVRGDLDWIVMKCLEKDRTRRYETVAALAQDIQHYLANEPVVARPPSRVYRLRKFARRNRLAFGAGVAVAASLVIGAGVATWQAIVATRARSVAEAAQEWTMEALRSATDEVVEKLIGSKHELGPIEREYLEVALKRWQDLADTQGEGELSQRMQSEGALRVATLQVRLGERHRALANYRVAIKGYLGLVGQFPRAPQYKRELAGTYNNLGILLRELGDQSRARAEYEAGLAIQKALVEEYPDVPAYKQDLSASHRNLGTLLSSLGDHNAALAAFEEGLAIQESLVDRFPDVPEFQQGCARAHYTLGALLVEIGNLEAARNSYQAGLAIQSRLVEQFPNVAEYQQDCASSHNNLGVPFSGLGDFDAARAAFDKGRTIRKKLVEQFPAVPEYQQELAGSHVNLGILFGNLGKDDDARAEYEAALAIQQTLVERYPAVPGYKLDLAKAHYNLGNLLRRLGHRNDARVEYEAGLAINKKLVDQFPSVPEYQQVLAGNQSSLGVLLNELGDRTAAIRTYEESVAIQRNLVTQFPSVPAYQRDLALSRNNLGNLLRESGDYVAALAELEAGMQIQKKLSQQFPTVQAYREDVGTSYYNLGILACDAGKPVEGLELLDTAVHILDAFEAQGRRDVTVHEALRRSHRWRAEANVRLGKHAEAVSILAMLTQDGDWNAEQWYDFACEFSIASTKLPDLQSECVNRATKSLRKAIGAGYSDVEHLKSDPDLAPLREREDFRKLVAELEAAAQP